MVKTNRSYSLWAFPITAVWRFQCPKSAFTLPHKHLRKQRAYWLLCYYWPIHCNDQVEAAYSITARTNCDYDIKPAQFDTNWNNNNNDNYNNLQYFWYIMNMINDWIWRKGCKLRGKRFIWCLILESKEIILHLFYSLSPSLSSGRRKKTHLSSFSFVIFFSLLLLFFLFLLNPTGKNNRNRNRRKYIL